MALAKKPTLVKSKTAAKLVAKAAKAAAPTFNLVPYTFRLDESLLERVKGAAAGQSTEAGQKVTVTAFMIGAILDKVKKYESGE